MDSEAGVQAKKRCSSRELRWLLFVVFMCMWFKGRHARSCTYLGVLTGEECKGKVGQLNIAIARNVGDTTDAWPCVPLHSVRWTRIFCVCPLPMPLGSFIIKTSQESFIKYLIALGKLLAATVQVNPEITWQCSKVKRIIVVQKGIDWVSSTLYVILCWI